MSSETPPAPDPPQAGRTNEVPDPPHAGGANLDQSQPIELRRAITGTRKSLRDSWFDRQPPQSGENFSIPPPPPVPMGHPVWSAVASMIAGAAGGIAALAAADYVARRMRIDADVTAIVGGALRRFSSLDARPAGMLLAVLTGAALGALFGRVTRRLFRIVPRILFAVLLLPAIWLLVHTLVLGRFAPTFAHALPFLPMLGGMVAYAACVGVVPPIRRKRRSTDL